MRAIEEHSSILWKCALLRSMDRLPNKSISSCTLCNALHSVAVFLLGCCYASSRALSYMVINLQTK